MKVTIVGGGLVGSLLATYLGQKGFSVAVYERRSDMRKANISAGKSINMACSTRGWQALDKVGVADQIRKAAIPMNGRVIHSPEGELTFQPYGQDGEAIYSISRAGLNKILMSFSEGSNNVSYHFNQKCTDIDFDAPSATFQNSETGEIKEVKSDLIFGADGAFSAVRNVMQKQDRFTYSQTYISHSYKELHIPAGENGTFLMEKKALHIWPRGQFMLIALPNPDGSFTCTLFLPYEGKTSFQTLTERNVVQAFFEKEFADALQIMPTLVDDFFENPTSSLAVIRCFPWTYEDKVCLIGDASHGIVPFYGQGMISGFEDCFILDQLIDQVENDWETIFKTFEKSRKPNTDAIADLALHNFIVMRDLVAKPDFLLKKKVEKKLQRMFPEKFTPLYSMVSFSNIPYAEALERGKKQDVLLDEILTIKGLEEKMDSSEIEEKIREMFENFSES